MKVIIKNYNYRGRNFTIIKDQGFYMAIEDKYLDENGCLNQQLCGKQLYPAREVKECMKHVNNECDIAYHIENGMSKAEAFSTVLGIPVEMAAALFRLEA